MAKVKKGLIDITGKIGDTVVTSSRRYARHIKKVVQPGTKKNEPALKEQYSRTAFLNKLASGINVVITELADNLKPGNFYSELQRRFRREPTNNRFLLLQQLADMEVNAAYPLERQGRHAVALRIKGQKVVVTVKTAEHPFDKNKEADCYSFEVSLVTWKQQDEPDCERQYSEWIGIEGDKPEFDFLFDKPAGAVHWLLCVRIRLGSNEKATGMLTGDGMQLVSAGSFDRREQAMLAEKVAARKEIAQTKQVVEVKRVKAKGN